MTLISAPHPPTQLLDNTLIQFLLAVHHQTLQRRDRESGGPSPDPGAQTADDAACRQMSESQLTRRPVLVASEADYGYSDLDYYPPAGGFSSSQLDPQASLDSDSAGYQDTAAYEEIGPNSTTCGRNNADDAQKAASSAENKFAANLPPQPPPTADTGSRKDEIPSEIYANSQWTEFWQDPGGGGGESGIEGGGGESGIEGGRGCKPRDTVQYSSPHSPPVPVTGGGRCGGGGGGGGGGVGEKSKHETPHYSNPHSPPVPVSGGGTEGGGRGVKGGGGETSHYSQPRSPPVPAIRGDRHTEGETGGGQGGERGGNGQGALHRSIPLTKPVSANQIASPTSTLSPASPGTVRPPLDSSEYVEMGSQVLSPHSSVIPQNWIDPEMKKFRLHELHERKQHIDRMMRHLQMDTGHAQSSREFPRLPSPTPSAPQDMGIYRGNQFHHETGTEELPRGITRGRERRQQKLVPSSPSFYRQVLPGRTLPELPAPVLHRSPLPVLSDQESSDDDWVEDIEQCDRPAAAKMPPAAEIMEPGASTAKQFISRYREIIQRKTAKLNGTGPNHTLLTQRSTCLQREANVLSSFFRLVPGRIARVTERNPGGDLHHPASRRFDRVCPANCPGREGQARPPKGTAQSHAQDHIYNLEWRHHRLASLQTRCPQDQGSGDRSKGPVLTTPQDHRASRVEREGKILRVLERPDKRNNQPLRADAAQHNLRIANTGEEDLRVSRGTSRCTCYRGQRPNHFGRNIRSNRSRSLSRSENLH